MQKPYLFMCTLRKKWAEVFLHKKGIAANTVIEMSPVIVMSSDERKLLDKTLLHDYIFEWGEEK